MSDLTIDERMNCPLLLRTARQGIPRNEVHGGTAWEKKLRLDGFDLMMNDETVEKFLIINYCSACAVQIRPRRKMANAQNVETVSCPKTVLTCILRMLSKTSSNQRRLLFPSQRLSANGKRSRS